ncbi:translocation/assembly module TamB domain-containing protein [Aequorivita echinoideorum]|uniref:Translocation/assembly module TamB domain-containing protein n=1 Tax=Aequorivita echinoideorum TaxID=1549647 RepID=A0ABS5S420_9FLAO|nr:translocation/assembly module TamB domain-containing protein [Aequorivita echinoideorum]MBT0607955.1 translocation/assembly module TamB domain-containing protein [Aequorivita echinoideorum]
MEKKEKKKTKSKKNRFLRIIAKVFAALIILIILLILFIRSPWGQGIIVDYATNYVSEKTNTKVEIEKLFVTFGGNIMLKGLYLEDKKGDTLIYSKSLEADIPFLPIIKGNAIAINYIDWEGLRANIVRKDSVEGYNFQFLMDAFVATDTTSVASDTTSNAMEIVLGSFNFKDFNIVYNDEVLGIDSQFEVGKLSLEMKKTDLETMDFRALNASISNSRIKYHQSPVPPDPNAEPVPLPFLQLDELSLKNVFADYQSMGDGIAANLEIIDFYLELPKADLVNNDIEIGDVQLKNSIITLTTESTTNAITEKAKETTEQTKEEIQAFEWPDFKIAIANIDLEQNNISYLVENAEAKENIFNPNAIVLKDFNLQANKIFLKEKNAGLNLESLTFEEFSGFNLKEMALNLEITDRFLDVNDIAVSLNNNLLNGEFKMDYPSLAKMIEAPDQSKIALDFPRFQVDLKEIFKFQPELRKNEYLVTLSKRYLTGNAKASGYLSSIQIPNVNIRWGNTTRISASGLIQNATDPDNLQFNIPRFTAQTKRRDLLQFVNEQDFGVSLPENVSLKGNAKGNVNDVFAKAELNTSQGIAIIDGHFKNDADIAFDADLEIKEYKLNELLNNEQLGALSLNIKTSGKGSDINTLDATLDATISSFQFNNYEIKDLAINGNIKDGKGNVVSKYKDQNLNLDLNAGVVLDSVAPEVNISLNLIGVNLQSLGVMTRDVRAALKLDAEFKGNAENFDVISTIGDGVVVYDNKTYLLGNVLATAHVEKDTTSIWFDNKILQLQLESNTDPATFGTAVQRHIASYFSREIKLPDSITNPVKLNIKGRVAEDPVLNEVFLVNVKELDTITLAVDFDERARKLKADINAPHINYGGNEIDSLAFSMDTDREKFVFDLGFNNIKAGPIDIQKTKITGNQQNNELSLGFNASHKDSTLINIQTKITGDSTQLRFHVVPADLILNKKTWETPAENEIIITENNLEFNDFIFRRNSQTVEVTDKLPNVSKTHVAIDFKNFRLSEILNYLNPDEKLATGNLNGNLVFEEPFGNTGLLADLYIEKLKILDVNLGRLSIDAKSLGGNNYDFNLALKEGEVDLDLTGDYVATETEAKLNLDLDINEFKMKALEGFSLGEITDTDGSFSGNFNVTGSPTEPEYEGSLYFDDAAFKIKKLNAPFTLANEELQIDNSGLSMDNFTIRDENNNKFVISGKVGTESFVNPTFDLELNATNFQVLNATEDDNDFLYGKAAFDVDATLTGDLQIPVLDMNLDVNDDTNVTYVMPASSVAIEERDGVVLFVNRENPDAILTRTQQETGTLGGFDVSALLKIGKAAKITIVLDEETGDNFKVFGDGDLDFKMNPNGQMTLAGVYEIAGGHYEMNLYNLVNRRFELAPGGRVSWSGDPFDAKLDVSAIYKLETSASALMAPTSSSADPSFKSRYRQVLPFYVYLNVDGELTQPVISFNLDMPEDEQGAVGGQVYGRVQQLNQQEDELNRQVFSLLVLNRFYPDPGSDGSNGGFATVARDNINDAVSDQLNTFSNKLLGNSGVELDFGLASYTDYQGDTPQERTQLDIAAQKKLFNDRLIVRVGSEVDIQGSSQTNEPAPLIGNVSLEYLLTENGRYRLRGFRRNQFENVIDGQTIASGIALIFTQEFNKFDELWEAILKGETQQEKADRKEAEEKKKAQKEEEEQQELEKRTGTEATKEDEN